MDGNSDLGNVFLASEAKAKFAQGQNREKGQRQIETTCARVKDIRRASSKCLI